MIRSVVGMTTLGVLGFVGLGLNIFGAVGGICIGCFLGRYFGKKISKRLYSKNGNLKEYDIFLIRLQCVLKWVDIIH
jgi:membrane associated rhomboid family serine protease